MWKVIGVALGLLVLWGAWSSGVNGWHYQTSSGEHTGYVTAVETTGVFYKTNTAYVKTDPQSSQEDSYCVVDPAVQQELQGYSQSRQLVTVSYVDWFIQGWKYCNGEQAGVITAVRAESGK